MIMFFFLPDIIELEHSFSYLRVYNNTVINRLEEEEDSFTSPTPNHKRGSPVENSLYVDCDASQGNHQPMWVTLNPSVGGPTGIISAGNDSYGVEILSDYMARLYFNSFDRAFEGVYRCLSAQSGNFVEIFITTGNHTLTLIECDNQLQFCLYTENPYTETVSPLNAIVVEGNPVTLEFKVAVDSNGNSWNAEGINFDFTPAGLFDREYGELLLFTVRSSAYPQNYIYSIESVDRSQEGLYTVTASSMHTYLH